MDWDTIIKISGPVVTLAIAVLVHLRSVKSKELEHQKALAEVQVSKEAKETEAHASVEKTVIETFAQNLEQMQTTLTRRQETIDARNKEIEELRGSIRKQENLSRDLFIEVQVHRAWSLSIPIPYWCKTVDHRFVFVNRAWEKLTGFRLENVAGRSNSEIGLPPEVARDWDSGDDKAVAAGGELVVEPERATNSSGELITGRSGKWLINVTQLGGKPFIMGCWLDDEFWGLTQ